MLCPVFLTVHTGQNGHSMIRMARFSSRLTGRPAVSAGGSAVLSQPRSAEPRSQSGQIHGCHDHSAWGPCQPDPAASQQPQHGANGSRHSSGYSRPHYRPAGTGLRLANPGCYSGEPGRCKTFVTECDCQKNSLKIRLRVAGYD